MSFTFTSFFNTMISQPGDISMEQNKQKWEHAFKVDITTFTQAIREDDTVYQ